MDLGLAGRVALVTGGSRGIGRAIGEQLAAEGCRVGLCARDGEAAREAAAALPGPGPHHGGEVDASASGALEAWVPEAAAALGGPPELLVANVGGRAGGSSLLEAGREDWTATFDLNVGHAVEALRACVEPMAAAGRGAAVLVSSVSGSRPQPGAQYGAAKAALDYAAATLARELGPRGIRVVAVAPGSTLFEGGGWAGMRERDPDAFAAFERDEFPHGRLGTPEEVARVVAFLLSDAASWVSGTTVTVDGAQNAPSARGY